LITFVYNNIKLNEITPKSNKKCRGQGMKKQRGRNEKCGGRK
jgi:hypothetical protein